MKNVCRHPSDRWELLRLGKDGDRTPFYVSLFHLIPERSSPETSAMPTSNLPHPPVSSVPVEMCELSELCGLSRQDTMESLSVKGAMGGVGLFFEETQGLGRPIASGCSLFNHF
jgi:hypothetical protein